MRQIVIGSVHPSCLDEKCGPCVRAGQATQATHKVAEELMDDEPRHPLSQYVCCEHFLSLMGEFNNCGHGRYTI